MHLICALTKSHIPVVGLRAKVGGVAFCFCPAKSVAEHTDLLILNHAGNTTCSPTVFHLGPRDYQRSCENKDIQRGKHTRACVRQVRLSVSWQRFLAFGTQILCLRRIYKRQWSVARVKQCKELECSTLLPCLGNAPLFICMPAGSHVPEGERTVCFIRPHIVTHLPHCASYI